MAIVADLANFRLLFPEFDPVSDTEVQFYIDLSLEELSTTYWGDCYDRAALYLAAHQLALSQNRRSNVSIDPDGFVETSSGAGAITQASAGGLSASYSPSLSDTSGSDRDSWLNKTEYGQNYLALKRTCMPLGVRTVCVSSNISQTS